MDDDNNNFGCGCGSIFLIIGLCVIFAFHIEHPEATALEKFLYYSAILLGTLTVSTAVTLIVASLKDDNHENNGGCLSALFGFGGGGSTSDTTSKQLAKERQYIHIGSMTQTHTATTSGGGSQSENDPNTNSEQDNNDKDRTLSASHTEPRKPRVFIEKNIFERLKTAVNSLNDFCYEQACDDELRQYIVNTSRNGIISLADDARNVANFLYQVAMKDVFTCMGDMGYPVNSLSSGTYDIGGNKKIMDIKCNRFEGQMLFAMLFIEDNRYAGYSDFKSVVTQVIAGKKSHDADVAGESLFTYMTSEAEVTADSVKDYQLALVFGSVGMTEEQTLYKKLLYEIMSCFAFADGTLSDKEKALLKQLGNEAGIADIGITVDGAPDASIETLNNLIGLQEVKQSIRSLVNFIKTNQKRKSMGMRMPSISYHCVFTGNPGTGKTTVARILAGIYKNIGILQKGQLIETDRSGLVAEYVGQTAVKTNKIIDKAIGGVLFIDEAYSLVGGGNEDYGKEAIATLLKRMEDNRDKLVVILAGYNDEMEEFINSNPGLRSRFNRYIHFPDYSAEELYQIFLMNMRKFDYRLTHDADALLKEALHDKVEHKQKDFGNAREVRNLFEKVVEAQSDRLQSMDDMTKEDMSKLTVEDIKRASKV